MYIVEALWEISPICTPPAFNVVDVSFNSWHIGVFVAVLVDASKVGSFLLGSSIENVGTEPILRMFLSQTDGCHSSSQSAESSEAPKDSLQWK